MVPERRARVWLFLGAVLLPWAVAALIEFGRGNDPVHDGGWPAGALAVANQPSRIAWWEGPPFGGGQRQFQYRGDTDAFSRALLAFAAIQAPDLDLVLHDGPQEDSLLRDADKPGAEARIDWTFTVWNPESWHRLYNDPRSVFMASQPGFRQPVDPPRLDVYLGGGGVDWAKVAVPANVRVRDERAAAGGADVSAGGLVRAQVYDMATGKPITGARLVAECAEPGGERGGTTYKTVCEAHSDAAGRVQADKLPVGTLRLWVSAPGYAPRLLTTESCNQHIFKNLQTSLAKESSLDGSAVDDTGKPLAGVTVSPSSEMAIDGRGYGLPNPPKAVTDAAGRFTLAGLPAGYMQVRARLPGHCFSDQTIHAVPSAAVALRLSRAGGLVVATVDPAGKAVARFEDNPLLVEVESKDGAKIGTWGGSAQVKDDGTVVFTDILPGEYRVWVHPNPSSEDRQYAPDQFVRIEPGGRTEVRFVLGGPPGPTVRLEIRAATGEPAAGFSEMTVAGSERRVFVGGEVLLSNDAIRSARVTHGEGAAWQIEVVFTEAGGGRFAEITEAATGRPLAIVVEGGLLSAPIVREPIAGGKAVITGAFSEAEARRIARGLAGGQ